MRRLIASLVFFVMFGLSQGGKAGEVLVLNAAGAPPLINGDGSGFVERVVGEAFRRNGFELRVVRLPAERGLRNANAGIEDGEIGRTAGMEKRYPNLVRVPEAIITLQLVAFSRKQSVDVRDWSTLRPYRVAVIKGWKVFEDNLRGIVAPTFVDDADQLFNVLERDHVDVVLYERWMGLALSRRRALRDVRALSPPLGSRSIFTYLHKKHLALVPKVAAALRAIKTDGTYRRAFEETIGPLSRP